MNNKKSNNQYREYRSKNQDNLKPTPKGTIPHNPTVEEFFPEPDKVRSSQELEDVFSAWKKESGLKGIIQFSKYVENGVLGIFVSSPGIMIGKNGILTKKYLPALQAVQPEILSLKFYETHNWFIK